MVGGRRSVRRMVRRCRGRRRGCCVAGADGEEGEEGVVVVVGMACGAVRGVC